MERNHYFENYINNLQKDIFILAYDSNYEITSFINAYMKSHVRKEMDKPYSSWHNQNANRIIEEILEISKIKTVISQTVNRDAVEWLGFFYSRWHFISGESSKTIIRFLPVNDGLKNYYTLHQLDENEAIEICKRRYNLSRNNHRAHEYKSVDVKSVDDNPLYYSFLATKLLYKLTRNPIFRNVKYVGDRKEYDFADSEYALGIKTDVIFKTEYQTLFDKYYESESKAINYSKRSIITIYFCFVLSDYYSEENSNEKLLLDINTLKSDYPPNRRHYHYFYFYAHGRLYEITPSNELYIYSISISNRGIASILNDMKANHLI